MSGEREFYERIVELHMEVAEKLEALIAARYAADQRGQS
jgi:hypothetical protein